MQDRSQWQQEGVFYVTKSGGVIKDKLTSALPALHQQDMPYVGEGGSWHLSPSCLPQLMWLYQNGS